MGIESLTVVLVYPDLLGTYGDRGNAVALRHRARARGLSCEVVDVELGRSIPRQGDVYLIGGGEDASMLVALRHLADDHALVDAIEGGAACLGVCAGFQLLAREFADSTGAPQQGLGLLDVRCGRLDGPRAVGEVLVEDVTIPGVGFLTGFENHQGDAVLGADARPLGRLVAGRGNGDGRTEGAVQGRVVGTYLHGPALVRNDSLADHLLQEVVGSLAPYDDELVHQLRAERRAAALGS